MSSIRRITVPALSTALAALLYLTTAVSASAQTYLPGGDEGAGVTTVVRTSGLPIWQFAAVALATAAITVGLFLAVSRLRHSHRLSIA